MTTRRPTTASAPPSGRWRHAAYLSPLTERGQAALGKLTTPLPITNRDPNKLTVLAMTGVTAMARNSAVAIDRSGDPGFLARQVGPELAAADLTTTSNEISIFDGCVADNTLNNVLLCSKPAYWENLEFSGIDAIGLTGNHMNDFSYDNFRSTLQLYADKQMPTYGGGGDENRRAQAADPGTQREPAGLPGLQPVGTGVVSQQAGRHRKRLGRAGQPRRSSASIKSRWSPTSRQPSSRRTSFSPRCSTPSSMRPATTRSKPLPQEETDFRALSDGGADVVTGIMAHAPQAVELRDGREILYGLGNLYFDQTWSWPTRTGLVARHTIYDGKLINTELLVTVIQDNFQLRWATPKERMQVLRSVFDVSRW